jgi:ATP-dependent RNA helicase DeaD
LGRGDATPYRGIIDELAQESGADVADLAAALASLVQGKTPLVLAKRAEEPAATSQRPERRGRDARTSDEPHRLRGAHRGEQLLYRLSVGRSHGIKVGNIVGAIANVGGIQGSDINGVDIQRDETFVRLPEGIAPETLERIGQVKIRGRLLAIRLADAAPAPKKKKKKN